MHAWCIDISCIFYDCICSMRACRNKWLWMEILTKRWPMHRYLIIIDLDMLLCNISIEGDGQLYSHVEWPKQKILHSPFQKSKGSEIMLHIQQWRVLHSIHWQGPMGLAPVLYYSACLELWCNPLALHVHLKDATNTRLRERPLTYMHAILTSNLRK